MARRTRVAARWTRPTLHPVFDGRFGGQVTVWWIVVRGNLDHEAHHRGQLATWLAALDARSE